MRTHTHVPYIKIIKVVDLILLVVSYPFYTAKLPANWSQMRPLLVKMDSISLQIWDLICWNWIGIFDHGNISHSHVSEHPYEPCHFTFQKRSGEHPHHGKSKKDMEALILILKRNHWKVMRFFFNSWNSIVRSFVLEGARSRAMHCSRACVNTCGANGKAGLGEWPLGGTTPIRWRFVRGHDEPIHELRHLLSRWYRWINSLADPEKLFQSRFWSSLGRMRVVQHTSLIDWWSPFAKYVYDSRYHSWAFLSNLSHCKGLVMLPCLHLGWQARQTCQVSFMALSAWKKPSLWTTSPRKCGQLSMLIES